MFSHFSPIKSAHVITDISVSPSDSLITQGETRTFSAKAIYSDGSSSDVTSSAQWTVTGNVTLANNFSIVAISAGSGAVTASFNGLTDTAEITVEPASTVFVSITTGSDITGTGSSNNPYQTLDCAYLHATGKIYMAAGNYFRPTQLTLSSGIAFFGGYSSVDWSRNIQKNITRISDTSGANGSITYPSAPILITAGNPELNGLYIDGGTSAAYSAAVHVTGGSPSITACILDGGLGSSSTYGLKIDDASAIVKYSVVKSGTSGSSAYVYGIDVSNISTKTLLLNNSLISVKGATGSIYAVRLVPSSTLSTAIYNCAIITDASSSFSSGLYLSNDINGNICNNTIITYNSSLGYTFGLYGSLNTSYCSLMNNILTVYGNPAKTRCIGQNSTPFMQIKSNLFFNESESDPVYFERTSTTYTWSAVNSYYANFDTALANIKGDPLFVSENDLHLTEASPAKGSGLNGSLWTDFPKNESSVPVDLSLTTRPASSAWSIGAYQ